MKKREKNFLQWQAWWKEKKKKNHIYLVLEVLQIRFPFLPKWMRVWENSHERIEKFFHVFLFFYQTIEWKYVASIFYSLQRTEHSHTVFIINMNEREKMLILMRITQREAAAVKKTARLKVRFETFPLWC